MQQATSSFAPPPNLLKLAGFTNDARYVDIAHQALAQMRSRLAQHPLVLGQWLQALSYALSQPREIAITGDPEADDSQALLTAAWKAYRPFQVVAVRDSHTETPAVLLFQARSQIDGRATAQVCVNFSCQPATTVPEAPRALLERP